MPVVPRGLRSLFWARSKPRRILSAVSLLIFTVIAGSLGILQFFGVSAQGVSATSSTSALPDLALGKLQVSGGVDGKQESLDITVRNRATTRALLTTLQVRIERFLYLPVCLSQGEVAPSARYPLSMPDNPAAGTVLSVDLHDDVPAGGFDRFVVPLAAPRYRKEVDDAGKVLAWDREASFLYQVSLTLNSDESRQGLPLGRALLATPWDPMSQDAQFWDLSNSRRADSVGFTGDQARGITKCLDDNSKKLAAFLRLDGERSSLMQTLTKAGLSDYVRAHSHYNQFG